MTGSDTRGETYLPSQLGLHGIIDGSLRLSFSGPGSPCKILIGYCLLSLSFSICIPARTITNQLCEEDEYSEEKVLGPAFLKVCYSSMGGYISSVRIFFFFLAAGLIRTLTVQVVPVGLKENRTGSLFQTYLNLFFFPGAPHLTSVLGCTLGRLIAEMIIPTMLGRAGSEVTGM